MNPYAVRRRRFGHPDRPGYFIAVARRNDGNLPVLQHTIVDDCMRPRELLLEAKSLVRRILRIPDPWKAFRDYERQIHPTTWADQPTILEWLDRVATTTKPLADPALDPTSPDPLVRLFAGLWPALKGQFGAKYANRQSGLRTVIHPYLPSISLPLPTPYSRISARVCGFAGYQSRSGSIGAAGLRSRRCSMSFNPESCYPSITGGTGRTPRLVVNRLRQSGSTAASIG